jgi:hypothetical protein
VLQRALAQEFLHFFRNVRFRHTTLPLAGAQLMDQLLEGVAKHSEEVKEIYLHVQTSNVDAVRFYSRLGFEVTETVENYYRGIEPPHCKSPMCRCLQGENRHCAAQENALECSSSAFCFVVFAILCRFCYAEVRERRKCQRCARS